MRPDHPGGDQGEIPSLPMESGSTSQNIVGWIDSPIMCSEAYPTTYSAAISTPWNCMAGLSTGGCLRYTVKGGTNGALHLLGCMYLCTDLEKCMNRATK